MPTVDRVTDTQTEWETGTLTDVEFDTSISALTLRYAQGGSGTLASDLVWGKDTSGEVGQNRPAVRSCYIEPNYGGTNNDIRVCRITGAAEIGENRMGPYYSKRDSWNADGTYMMVFGGDERAHLYHADKASTNYMKHVKALYSYIGKGSEVEPTWHESDPNLIYFLAGTRIRLYDLRDNTISTVVDFAGRLNYTIDYISTKDEGSPSKDRQRWVLLGHRSGTYPVVFCWDRTTDTVVSQRVWSESINWVGCSAGGKYAMVQIDQKDSERTMCTPFNDLSSTTTIVSATGHGDPGLDANGDETYVYMDWTGVAFDGPAIRAFNMDTGQYKTIVASSDWLGSGAFHPSMKAFDMPGWALVSNYTSGGNKHWFSNKVFAINATVGQNNDILNIAHHRSDYTGAYYTEPHATCNRDFTRVMFRSNWEDGNATLDAYLVELPADAFGGGSAGYVASGERVSPDLDVTDAGLYSGSSISWNATLNGQTLSVAVSHNGGAWQTCTNGAAIPGFTDGQDLTGHKLRTRVSMSTGDDTVTPSIASLTVSVTGTVDTTTAIHAYDGTTQQRQLAWQWDGTQWVALEARTWNGTEWE